MATDKNGKGPVSHTFRMEWESYERLEAEAGKKKVSINVALNQVMREHTLKSNFDRIESTITPNDVLKGLLEMLDERDIVRFARKLGSHNAIEYILLLYGDTNKNTVLKFLDVWSGRFAGYEHKMYGETHWFSVPHGISEKFSVFLAEFVRSLVDSTIREPVKIETSQRTVMFQL